MLLPEKIAKILSKSYRYKYTLAVVAFILLSNYSTFFSHDHNSKQQSINQPSRPRATSHTNISHILFGIAASSRTWQRRGAYAELWWRPNLTRGHVWLDKPPVDTEPPTYPPYRVSAVNKSRFGARRAAAARIASIVAESYRLRAEGVRWFVMGDDDTVYFTENLVGVLGKYDHKEMWYVGGNSESVEQDEAHSYGMAFGGGGFAVSLPAAGALARAMEDGGCLERYNELYGSDQRVHACLSELGVPLTREPGFHQVDLRGDVYGMLAAHPIAPLVSLHHLDSVKPLNPRSSSQIDAVRSLMNASQFDPARTLQQTVCYLRGPTFNWSISVSWGYTVQLYPWSLVPKELEVPLQTFSTWKKSRTGQFTFNTREFKMDRPCEKPVLFFLEQVENWNEEPLGVTKTMTLFSKYEQKGNNRCDLPSFTAAMKVDNITVIAPKMDDKQWRKAPRRQCCEAYRQNQGKSIEVRIRDCYSGEITSPP